MKRIITKLTMLALALVGGAQMMWAETQSTVTNYDFEDDVPLFTAVAGNGGATRVTVSVATPESATTSKAVQFATAGNADRGSAAAKYDFSELVKNAVKVTVEFDCKLGDYMSGTFSIGDASTRDVAGGKGTWGYTNTGAIWSIGINRGKLSGSSSNTNNIRINGVDLGATKNSYLKDWIHVQVTVDVTNKKVSYNVTKTGDASDIIASADNVDFVSDDALSCSQIDLFGGTSSVNYYVDNLQIVSYVDDSQKYYDYTVKYLYDDNGTEIKESATRNALEGTVPELLPGDKSAIFYENEKYIYESDNAAELTVGEGTIVNVKFRKATKYTYTVNASYSDKTEELVQGSNFEGETIYAVYPQYYNVGGTLYEAGRGNAGYYKCSFVPDKDNYVHTITYSESAIKNVVYFSEAEDIEGMTKTTSSNADIRCSYGAGGYSANVVTATTLQPGKYKVKTVVWGKANNSIIIKAGEATVHTATTTGSITSAESEEFEIITATPITIEGAASSYPLDYIYIVKTAEVITLPTDYTYSTFCSTSALDFTDNKAVEAYIATADGTTVTLNQVNKVPANTGLILKKIGDATTATVPVAESVDAIGENHLVAVTKPVTAEELLTAGNAYILVSDTQFSKVVSGATGAIPAGKAYLVYNALKGASAMRLYVGEATAAASVEAQAQQAEQAVYTLQGIRMSRPTAKGLYIVDGKVCLFK